MVVKYIIEKILYMYNLVIKYTYKILFHKIDSLDDIQNILLFKTGSIGDNVIVLPFIASIKKQYSNIKITILTTSGKSPVSMENLIDKDLIEDFIHYGDATKIDLLNLLKDNNYDLVIDFTNPFSLVSTLRNMFFFRYIGIKKGIGWHISELTYFRKQQDKYNLVQNEMQKYLQYLKSITIQENVDFVLGIDKQDILKIDKLLQKNNLENNKIIAIVVGAKRNTNRWPIEYFDEVIKWLKNHTEYEPIIIGGKEDLKLTKHLHSKVVNFAGILTPLESAELLKRCKLTISNDTGPMHLSYAVGTKVLAIFSARDFRRKWYPPKELGYVFRDEDIKCRLCYQESCDDVKCLKNIKPSMIIDKLKGIL
jgi:heptosyltransferase-2